VATNEASVTGGAGTLGMGAAHALLDHGLSGLMIFDINPAQAQEKIDMLKVEFPHAKIRSIKVDIRVDIAVREAFAKTSEVLGKYPMR
jgi:sorbose reductase